MHRREKDRAERRKRLARRIDRLESLERRNMATEALGSMAIAGVLPAAIASTAHPAEGATTGNGPAMVRASESPLFAPIQATAAVSAPHSGGAAHASEPVVVAAPKASSSTSVVAAPEPAPLPPPGGDAVRPINGAQAGGGGSAGSSHGATVGTDSIPTNGQGGASSAGAGQTSSSSSDSLAPSSAPVVIGQDSGQTAAAALSAGRTGSGSTGSGSTGGGVHPTGVGGSTGGGGVPGGIHPDLGGGGGENVPLGEFNNFTLYTLDETDGTVLFPGDEQLAKLGDTINLVAQVAGSSGYSYSWNTLGLSAASSVSGSSTDDLQIQWESFEPGPTTNSVTLTVTDGSLNTETQTYTFAIPGGSVLSAPTNPTWPESYPSNLQPMGTSLFAQDNTQGLSIDSNTGGVSAVLDMPSYSPNIPGLVLSYDSLTAAPQPIIVEHHTLDPTLADPSEVSAQLTFDGVAGSTYYYDGTGLAPGDVLQIAPQADATSLSTGRYAYSLAIGDVRGSTTTTTVTGTATVINNSSSALGDGWSIGDMEQLYPESGGAIVDASCPECGRTSSFWFTSAGSGAYTSPAGDFSTLVENIDGTYTRTLSNGLKINFNSSGYETSTVDLNGLTTSYGYNGSNELTTITDPYGEVTTLTYASGELATITDPAGRVTTLTHSGSELTGAATPGGLDWSYTYDGSGRVTSVTDPDSHTLTVTYDSGGRADGTERPDSTTESVTPYERQGWVPSGSGTSGSPATPVLLAQATANYTDPDGYTTQLRPDWYGLGSTAQTVDDLGDVETDDYDANGLTVTSIDAINEITQVAYDDLGNPTLITAPDGTTQSFTYNGYSEPLTATDQNGETTSFTYDSHGNNTVIEDPLTNRTTMTYTADGMLATSKDPLSRVTTYQYDSQDRLTTITYPDSTTTLLGYDSAGDVTSTTDERGYTTTASYDLEGWQTGTTDPLNDHVTMTYDGDGMMLTDQEPLSRTTTMTYTAEEWLWTDVEPIVGTTTYTYGGDGEVLTVEDPMDRVTSYSYGHVFWGEVLQNVTDPDDNVTTYVYDPIGQMNQADYPLGRTTTVTYTLKGQISTIQDTGLATTTYTYTPTGELATQQGVSQLSDGVGDTLVGEGGGGVVIGVISYAYDIDGRQTTVTDPNGGVTTTTYNAGSEVTSVTDPNGNVTSYAYNVTGETTSVTDGAGDVTSYAYDADGDQTVVTDPLNHATTTAYDALDRATTITDADGDVTTMAYDAAGREVGLTDPDGNHTTWTYNAADQLTQETTPLGSTTYSYDADSEVTSTTDRDGRVTTFSYDGDGDVTGETWVGASPAEKITYTYDADNEMTEAADSFATLTWTYDSSGEQTGASTSGPGTDQPAVSLSSSYDVYGNRTSLSDNLSSVGETSFAFDGLNRMTTITTSYGGTAGPQVVFGYDGDSNMTSISRTTSGTLTPIVTSMAYDSADRLTTITDTLGGTSLDAQSYTYNAASEVSSETNAEGTVSYSYDNAGQLTGVSGSSAATYTYDSNGNRTMTGYTTGSDNELTASPGYTYTYDAEGNLTGQTQTSSGDVTTYSYDYRDRMVGATEKTSGGTVLMQATYVYDALDRRIETDETISGTTTVTWSVYDGENVYAEFNGSGSLENRYLYGPAVDEILARTSAAGVTAWYMTDHLGSVRDVVSSSGSVLDHIAYDAYGDVTSQSNAANGDEFQYAGMRYDPATEFDYAENRWYEAPIGRFISQDRTGFGAGDADLYRYVGNGPSNSVDPSGLAQQKTNLVPVPPGFDNPPAQRPSFPPESTTPRSPDFVGPPYVPPCLTPWLPNTTPMKPAPGKAPGFNDLLQDPTVQDAIGKAWLKCQVNPAKMVHEEGGIIYYNPITGDVVVVPFTGEFAPAVAPEGTLATTVMSGLAYPGYYIVGQFHTHPWNPFPSDLDVKNLAITGVPSIIIWPNGKNCTTYGPPQRIGGLAPRLPTPAGSWP